MGTTKIANKNVYIHIFKGTNIHMMSKECD